MGSRLTNQIKIGDLNEQIGFATKTVTVSDAGGMTESLSVPTANIPAMIRFDSTNEEERAKQEKFVQQIKIWVRYDSTYTEFKYVYWNSEYYDIYSIEKVMPGQRFQVIKARLIET